MEDNVRERLAEVLPEDSSAQCDAFQIIDLNKELFAGAIRPRLMDLGAGTGQSYSHLEKRFPDHDYVGVDIEASPEVAQRGASDLTFVTYDGVNLPFESDSFDIVFCKQVLEHVRQPDAVIAEVCRVLKPGGLFVGSVSQVEPYHSYSIFNWTAWGIMCVFGDAGLKVCQLRPGIDGVSLLMRRVFGKDRFGYAFANESLFNHHYELLNPKATPKQRNLQKLIIAGHIVFLARKP